MAAPLPPFEASQPSLDMDQSLSPASTQSTPQSISSAAATDGSSNTTIQSSQTSAAMAFSGLQAPSQPGSPMNNPPAHLEGNVANNSSAHLVTVQPLDQLAIDFPILWDQDQDDQAVMIAAQQLHALATGQQSTGPVPPIPTTYQAGPQGFSGHATNQIHPLALNPTNHYWPNGIPGPAQHHVHPTAGTGGAALPTLLHPSTPHIGPATDSDYDSDGTEDENLRLADELVEEVTGEGPGSSSAPLRIRIDVPISITGDDNDVVFDTASVVDRIARGVASAVKVGSAGEMGWTMVDGDGDGRDVDVRVHAGLQIRGRGNCVRERLFEGQQHVHRSEQDVTQPAVQVSTAFYGLPAPASQAMYAVHSHGETPLTPSSEGVGLGLDFGLGAGPALSTSMSNELQSTTMHTRASPDLSTRKRAADESDNESLVSTVLAEDGDDPMDMGAADAQQNGGMGTARAAKRVRFE